MTDAHLRRSRLAPSFRYLCAKPTHLPSLFCIAATLVIPEYGLAQDNGSPEASAPKFSTQFLKNGGSAIDLDDFLRGSNVLPGSYRVDIYINRNLSGRQDIVFDRNTRTGQVEACLTLDMLEALGLDMKALRNAGKVDDSLRQKSCYDLPAQIEHSSVEYDAERLHLNISVPQASMSRSARGYVDPALWDEGVNAAFTNYNFNGRRNSSHGTTSESYYLGMRNGINLGAWRLRNESTLSSGTGQTSQFKSNRTFAQRDITALKSQLTLGSTYTPSQTFDSVRIKGVVLASDDAMLPDSERGYAPTIRGDAETNATVEIRQNGYLLRSVNVTPGPFVIDDVYPNGSNGDLLITVIESDGRRRDIVQAYAALPQMVRRGRLRYDLALGKYDSNYERDESPNLLSSGLAFGLTDNTTLTGGLQWAPNFRATNLGLTRNTFLGAVSADITQSDSQARDNKNSGHSLRLLYSKTLSSTDTTLTLASYRYSTVGYRTLAEHIADFGEQRGARTQGRAKSRLDLTINQTLGQRSNGSLYFYGSEQRFWNLPGRSQQYQLGYSNTWRSMNYNIAGTYTRNPGNYNVENLTRLNLSLSFPLGGGSRAPRLLSNYSSQSDGQRNLQMGLNGGLAGFDDTYYSLQAGHDRRDGATTSASLSTMTSVARLDAGYSQGRDYRGSTFGANGSIVAHAGGVNLGQPLGESFALVEVPGPRGTRLSNFNGSSTGFNGYAVLPNTNPYRTNWVNLDTRDLGSDIEIDTPTQQLIPRRGSITLARFATKLGRRVQFELLHADGSRFPFGTSVETPEGRLLAIADPNGRALVLIEEQQGTLLVKSSGQTYSGAYHLEDFAPKSGYELTQLVVQPTP